MAPDKTGQASSQSDQASVIAFLSASEAHGGAEVQVIETHISRIFLAGDRAYKLKLEQKLPFLDFSTPALREAACRRELEVNAIAGDLYLGVAPIRRHADGALALGGEEGEAVDWVVVMRRFDRTQEFDRLLEQGALTRRDMEQLGDRIAEMHDQAPVRKEMGGPDAVRSTAGNLAEALSAPEWLEKVEVLVGRHAVLLEARREAGKVRRCHGDLHLANIVMIDGKPTPFDAIEFSETIATTDMFYDLAFSVMDLLSHDRADLANALVSRYLGATRDYEALALAPLFISIRAAIRAMAAEMRGAPEAVSEARRAMMWRALEPPPAPRLLVVAGLSGSGKSTLARALAPRVGALFGAVTISSDVTRKRLFGVAPEDALPSEAYRPDVSATVYGRMLEDARTALEAGACVVIDGVHGQRRAREPAKALARELGVGFRGIWLHSAQDERLERVAARRDDPSDADVDVAKAQKGETPWREEGWVVIEGRGSPADVLADAVTKL